MIDESYRPVLRQYAARALRRRVRNPKLPHGGNLVPTPEEAEQAVELALSRLDLPRDTLQNLFRRCLREVMSVAPALRECSAQEHAPAPRESNCPARGRHIKRAEKRST